MVRNWGGTMRVGIIADEALSRAGLRSILESQSSAIIVAEGITSQAPWLVRSGRPDVIVASKRYGSDFPDLLYRLKQLPESPEILAIAERVTEAEARLLLAHGAAGILLRKSVEKHLPWAVLAVARGSRALSPEIAERVIESYVEPAVLRQQQEAAAEQIRALSSREQQVLGLLSDGLPNRSIADMLYISPETVKDHVRAICAKLHAGSRLHAVRIAWVAAQGHHQLDEMTA